MNRSKFLLYTMIVIAVFSLILGVALNQEYVRMLVPLILGVLWIFTTHQKWAWGASFCTFGLLLFASLLQDIGEIWLSICLLACLIAWDLSYFLLDIQRVELVRQEDRIERDHLARLAIIASLSIIIMLLSRGLNFNLQFGWTLVLGFIIIIGFSCAISIIRESPSND